MEAKKDKYSYGVIAYNSINIGDEIQSVASMRFLPHIDEHLYREQISNFMPKSGKPAKCIMNAWWMWEPQNFPPSLTIEPLLISMHIVPKIRKKFLNTNTREYLIKYGPVGCRDKETYEWLQKENIPAYFSGCLTLTLQRNENLKREDYILCVDTNPELVETIRKRTKRPVYAISRYLSPFYSTEQRFKLAKIQLHLYHNAHLIVSSRLHVILPSLAMGTPVLRIISDSKEMGEKTRYSGYEKFFNAYTNEEIISNPGSYDFDNPLPNPENHIQMRENLIKKCSEFTGYNNEQSLISDKINPLVEMIQINKYSYENVKKVSYFAEKKLLLRTLLKKIFGYNKYSLIDNARTQRVSIKQLVHNKFKTIKLPKILGGVQHK